MLDRLLTAMASVLTMLPVCAVPARALAQATASDGTLPAAAGEQKAPGQETQGEQAEKVDGVASPRATALPICPKTIAPVYIDSWGRLAELTESDAEVGERARFWANRNDATSKVLAAGTIVGTGGVLLGTINRLTSDGWTTANKWEIAGGAGLALTSVLTWWLFSPDRGDLVTVINHWNLRHRDRPLAP